MNDIDLNALSEGIQNQMPLMYLSTALIAIAMVIILMLISEFIFIFIEQKKLSKREKITLIALTIAFLFFLTGMSLYVIASIKAINTVA